MLKQLNYLPQLSDSYCLATFKITNIFRLKHFKRKALNNITWLNNANRSHERDATDGLFEKKKNRQIHIFAFNFLKAQKQ